MKFTDEFIESAGQVAQMMILIQNIAGREAPLFFDTPQGRIALKVEIVANEQPKPIPSETPGAE